MLNLNSLYNAVFAPEKQAFNPAKDYFTILIDTPAFPLYEAVSSNMEVLINPDAYEYWHAENLSDISRDRIDERLSQVLERLDARGGFPPARRYCLFTYFDDQNRNYADTFNIVHYLQCDHEDVITLMVCLDGRMNGLNEYLEEISRYLCDWKVDLYVFTYLSRPYNRRILAYSICGAVVKYSNKEAMQKRSDQQNAVRQMIDGYIRTLYDDGRRYLETIPHIRWSTLCCQYYDRRNSYIRQYLLAASDKLVQLSEQDFIKSVREIYQALIPTKDCYKTLSDAVAMIPFVTESVPKKYEGILSDYFNIVYGGEAYGDDTGLSTVEMTLKATLSGIYNDHTEDIVRKCCQQIFMKYSCYAEADLYNRIKKLLDRYLDSVAEECKKNEKQLQSCSNDGVVVDQNESNDDYLKKFIQLFIQLYENRRAETFWTEVRRYIGMFPEEYRAFCDSAQNYYNQIQKLRTDISYDGIPNHDDMNVKSYTAEEILTLDKHKEECDRIRRSFDDIHDRMTELPSVALSSVFTLALDSHFYRQDEFKILNNSFSVIGNELNGEYFVFVGGKSDV